MSALDGLLVAAEIVEHIGAERVAHVRVSAGTHVREIGLQFRDAEDGNRAAIEAGAEPDGTYSGGTAPFQTWRSTRGDWTVVWFGAYDPDRGESR